PSGRLSRETALLHHRAELHCRRELFLLLPVALHIRGVFPGRQAAIPERQERRRSRRVLFQPRRAALGDLVWAVDFFVSLFVYPDLPRVRLSARPAKPIRATPRGAI